MHNQFNEDHRFGSARFATAAELRRAGMWRQTSDALFVGFIDGKRIWYSGAGGLLLTAGARGGKLRDLLAYNLCTGIYTSSMLVLDLKGELAAISRDQTPDNKFCINWNPLGLHDLPQHRINPVENLRIGSPTLVSDTKVFCENWIANSGSANSKYFEGRGREYLEAICLTIVKRDGVLTLPALYDAINRIARGGEAWLDFGFEMQESGFPLAARVEEEIAAGQNGQSGNGYQGIVGELFKAVACLSDPVLTASVSPPFNFSLSDLCSSKQAYQFYLMPPAEFVSAWAPVMKAMFVSAMLFKSRASDAPRQTWILDECGQLGGFPLITKLFTYGAGIGIRPWAVFQSTQQMNALGSNAASIIMSSAQLKSYFAVRDYGTANGISSMLGMQTLEYDDEVLHARARQMRRQAVQAFIGGDDPFAAGMAYAAGKEQAAIRSKQHRALMSPDEILNLGSDRQIIFCDDVPAPVLAERAPYYEQAFMAGRYHPNPYHPPSDRVRVKTRWGSAWRPVIRERVPQRYAHYPQYADGYWSHIGR